MKVLFLEYAEIFDTFLLYKNEKNLVFPLSPCFWEFCTEKIGFPETQNPKKLTIL